MFAWVEWTEDTDRPKGKNSIIPVTNIRGFDLDKWMDGLISQEEIFAVEWQNCSKRWMASLSGNREKNCRYNLPWMQNYGRPESLSNCRGQIRN